VPNNTAVLVTSANSRRVVEGPCVTLLGYEESLTSLSLSTGTPKSDEEPLRTCFLRTVGNRISDKITVETADFVKISVRVSYSVEFLGDHKERWFNHENYIQFIVDRLRSIVRGKCRTMSLSTLWPELPAVFRDTLLGERKDGARPGRLFTENGTLLSEVEVLGAEIEDREVAALMQKVQTESVTLAIGDRKAQETLASSKLRAEVERQTQELLAEARVRAAKLEELSRKLAHEAALAKAREDEAVHKERQSLADAREADAQKSRLARENDEKASMLDGFRKDAEARAEAQRITHEVELAYVTKLRELEIKLIEVQSSATVAERQAVQKQLVEAMVGLGDKLLLTEVAGNMNLVSLFKGKDVGTILSEVLGGTKVMPTLRSIIDASASPEELARPPVA
jgi:major vault protein